MDLRSRHSSPNQLENDLGGTHSDIFSGSLSNAEDAEDARDTFVSMVDGAALEEGMPAHEWVFDNLTSLRSELLNRPHLPNEEDTSIITAMVADLNEGVMTPTTHPNSSTDIASRGSASCT